ncbi:MAG: DUF4145 domain-containing protein [Sulfitobacter sp.]|nr:DUF4145 domain-containing protein [Sulfitobacter sp.]
MEGVLRSICCLSRVSQIFYFVAISEKKEDNLKNLLQQNNKIINEELSLTDVLEFERVITSLDRSTNSPPEYLPDDIELIMREGNKCLSAQCWNASAAMYRLALDMATKSILPVDGEPNAKVRRSLGLRLEWLFDTGRLPNDLKPLAECVQQDGNDGAHDGTLSELDAADLHDFSFELLRRMFTEPERIAIAERRRAERRNGNKNL